MKTESTMSKSTKSESTSSTNTPLPPVVDSATWQHALDELRVREKAVTRELDAIAAQRRRLPAVAMPDYTLESDRIAELYGDETPDRGERNDHA